MTLGTILLIILIVLLIGALPSWGYSRGWGYGASGILGLVLIVVLILFLMGRIQARTQAAVHPAVRQRPAAFRAGRRRGKAPFRLACVPLFQGACPCSSSSP